MNHKDLREFIREELRRAEVNEIFGWVKRAWRDMTLSDWEIVNRAARSKGPGLRTLTSSQWRALPRNERDDLTNKAHAWLNDPSSSVAPYVDGGAGERRNIKGGGKSPSSGGGSWGGGGGGYGYYDPYDPYGYGYGYGYGGGARSSSPSKEKDEGDEGDGDKGDSSDTPLYEIFGWSQKEKDAAAALKDAENRKRDEDFDRESIQNEKDWGDTRTSEHRWGEKRSPP